MRLLSLSPETLRAGLARADGLESRLCAQAGAAGTR
jgi:hypothetical protein